MEERLIEEDIRLYYRLLNHTHLTELRFLKRGKFPAYKIVRSEDEFVEACRAWNGKRNIYAGLRDRQKFLKRCANMFDIVGLQILVLDIDPIREPETPSTEEELSRAQKLAENIGEWFEREGYKRPHLAMTGNGYCLYFTVPYFSINDENRFEITDKLALFEQGIRRIFRKQLYELRCSMDSMYDLPRIAKVIGTLSVKGEDTPQRPWRVSRWIERPYERREDPELLQSILEEKWK
jgi:hypothetical protein